MRFLSSGWRCKKSTGFEAPRSPEQEECQTARAIAACCCTARDGSVFFLEASFFFRGGVWLATTMFSGRQGSREVDEDDPSLRFDHPYPIAGGAAYSGHEATASLPLIGCENRPDLTPHQTRQRQLPDPPRRLFERLVFVPATGPAANT